MPARPFAIPPQPALLAGADGRWLAAADLLSRDLGVVIIDPSGRFGAEAERLRDGDPDELLDIRDDERSFLRIAWLLEHPQHADVLRPLATPTG